MMAIYKTLKAGPLIMGKLAHGADLLDELTAVCVKENIVLGTLEAIGAVQKARIGYYDQSARQYQYLNIDHPLEIACLIGNISLKDDKPMIHAHITLADNQGRCYAGHLAAGTRIFACEFVITPCEGGRYVRDYDEQTGLSLWKF